MVIYSNKCSLDSLSISAASYLLRRPYFLEKNEIEKRLSVMRSTSIRRVLSFGVHSLIENALSGWLLVDPTMLVFQRRNASDMLQGSPLFTAQPLRLLFSPGFYLVSDCPFFTFGKNMQGLVLGHALVSHHSSHLERTREGLVLGHALVRRAKQVKTVKDNKGKPLRFSNVDEALAILPVASELLFQQCMEECMKYLSAVPWSTKQEVKLRALLLSLEISIWGDLSDRLGMIQCKQDLGGQQMLEQTLQKMLSTISSGSFVNGEYIEEYIIAHFNANESIAETCRSALLKEFSANIERAKFETPKSCSALSWIVKVIDRRDEELFETVFYMFCKDAKIPKVVYRYIAWDRYCRDNSGYSNRLVDIMDRFLKALRNGRIITCIPFRVSFLTNWISVLVNLKGNDKLVGSIVDVSETLPLVYQRRIYNVGKEAMNTYLSVDRFTRMVIEEWGKKLQEAIERHNFFDMTGKIY